jgi:hypothetical protein
VDADIWVGEVPPVGAETHDFWFDTAKVPLFGISIIGQLPGAGPPSPVNPPDGSADAPDPGDAWWDSDGGLWVWDGTGWVYQGNFRGPTGPVGPTGPPMGSMLPTGSPGQVLIMGPTGPEWVDPAVAFPTLSTWPLVANWVPDSQVPLP